MIFTPWKEWFHTLPTLYVLLTFPVWLSPKSNLLFTLLWISLLYLLPALCDVVRLSAPVIPHSVLILRPRHFPLNPNPLYPVTQLATCTTLPLTPISFLRHSLIPSINSIFAYWPVTTFLCTHREDLNLRPLALKLSDFSYPLHHTVYAVENITFLIGATITFSTQANFF